MNEIWKDYIATYQISNMGRIRNTKTNHILKTTLTGSGYLGCVISLNGTKKCIKVHRAVAQAFIPNPNNLPQVNHIDGCKTNNVWTNLEWVTNQENVCHSFALGLQKIKYKEDNPSSKLKQADVEYIRRNYIPKDKQYGIRALARKYNVCHKTIEKILNKETWL